jgi:hypothetical protein
MTTIATNLIAALTATFRADSQDLLTTVKELIRAFDAADDDTDFQTCDAVYRSLDAIQREVQDRIDHENDELSLDLNYPRDLLLYDVLACIAEFYN